jgi:hypothetical protein
MAEEDNFRDRWAYRDRPRSLPACAGPTLRGDMKSACDAAVKRAETILILLPPFEQKRNDEAGFKLVGGYALKDGAQRR